MAEQHEKALVPQIRFTGFTDPWEQRKVQDVADRFDNLRIPVAANLRVHGKTPYYGANGIQDYVDGFTHDGEFVLVAEDGANDLKNYPVKCVNGRIWVNNHAHVLQGKAGIADNSFLAFAISQSDIESLLVGGGRAKLNAETLMSIEFRLPCLQEQHQIGEYLTRLDHLITLHQRKYDKLCVLKKSMLDKMFPKGGSLYPEIRFAGFTDPWEQRKLEDYVVVSTAKNVDGRFNKEDVLSVSGEYGIVNQIAFQGRSFAGSSVLNYGIVNTGDIVYTKSPLNSNPYGIIKVNKGIPGIVSTLYAVYRPQDNVHTNFIQVYFEQHERMNNYMHPLVNKGAKNDMKVTAENALKGVVTFPSREEQVIISEFFDRLDSLITLHQRKLELLRNIKKSMLDKMFV
ncbi:restriction endonuclease subunit S [Bifidobacterium adolescentis]|uniref:restriction endonuclease subunit S n=1 Tax=Bifidobacterium adolescentis TaxID=1680 RepID=UPI004063BD88